MAAVSRRPFAVLDEHRLRSLGNVKNRQNALPVTLASPVKRPVERIYDDEDTENVDPNLAKKSKNLDGNPVKAAKATHFVLKETVSAPATTKRAILTPKRLSLAASSKTAPSSAPAATTRSTKSKRAGILSRRRVSSLPFTRVDPPSFARGPSSAAAGPSLSIDAALSGTIPSYTPKANRSKASAGRNGYMPNSWMFDIHEDAPEEELTNLMEFSTQTLDISDDEGKRRELNERGKENIPPPELQLPSAAPAAHPSLSRRDIMSDEPRTPLGDLDARDFYAEGLNADSVIIVPGEKGDDDAFAFNEIAAKEAASKSAVEGTTADNQDAWKVLMAEVDAQKAEVLETSEVEKPEENIEIWESESAKGQDDNEPVVIAETKSLEESLAAAEGIAFEI